MRPLYRDANPRLDDDKGHRGLWFDKFCDQWDGAWAMKAGSDAKGSKDGTGKPKNPKLEWIHSVTKRPVGSQDELAAYTRRLLDLLDARGGKAAVVKAQSRFVTGLGRSHPVENGFAWHPTLGTPYLPGSSVKGLVRAWAQENASKEEVARVLGDDSGEAGTVAFLDAVPLGPVTLEADVLTPHYANWTSDDPPGDWRSPIPVPFLVAAQGWRMLCGVIPLRMAQNNDAAQKSVSAREDDATDVILARDWLISALDELGAGAKTAVGYGHFQEDKHETVTRWEKERHERKIKATPEGRWRLALAHHNENDLLKEVHDHLGDNPSKPLDEAAERRAFVIVVLEKVGGGVHSWRRGKPFKDAQAGKQKLKGYAKAVLDAAAEFGIDPPS